MGRRRSRERSPRSTRHRSRSISRSKDDSHSSRSHRHTGDHHHSSHRKKHSKRKAHKSHHHSHHSGDSGRSRRRTVEISIGKDDLKSVLGSQAEFLFTSKADDGTSDSDVSSIDISGVDRGSHERGRTSVEHEFGVEKYDELSTQLKSGSPLCVFEGSSNVKGPMKIVLKGLQDEEKGENTMQKTHFHVNSHSLARSPQCNQMPDSRWHSDDEHSHSEQRERSLSGSREGSWEQAWEHSKDRTKDRSRDRSRDRARRSRNSSSDLFHGRSKDRSLDRSRRSRDRSRARSRDRSMDRSRDRPRRSRDRSRARSRDRSMDRPRRSRDRSRARSRDRSRDRLRGLRARSRESHHHSPRRSSSSDREHSYRSRAKQQKNRAEAPPPVLSKKRAEINEYTSICQQISAIDYLSVLSNGQEGATEIAASGVGGEVGSGVAAVVHPYRDPFAVKEAGSIATTNLVFHGSVWKTPTQAVLDGADPSSVGITAEKEFPVSDGIQHHAVEAADGPDDMGSLSGQVTGEVNVSELVMLQMCLAQRLSLNPDDHEAEQQLREVELKVKQWSSSSFKMGQYTGNVTLTSISAKEKQNTGIQAWVRRDMFQNLKPVGDGFGAKMLRKLGWKKGEPLGKSGTGCVEPVADEVKLDRKCLAADDEVAKQKKAKPQTFYPDSNAPDAPSPPSTAQGGPVCTTGCYVGKHPVSALNELCTRKKWTIQYELVMTSGPPHSRSFKYQVTLPVGSFQPDKMCGNKKLAKAEAAMCTGGFGASNYKHTFQQKEFRSDAVVASEKSSKELTGFTRERIHDPISARPLEAFTWDSQAKFMYPTSKSMMKQSFLPSSGLTGRDPLPSVSHKANHSNGFTKGNQATADFAPTASRPVGYTTSQQIHPLSMNTVKRESPAEAMNIVNPHNRSTVAQLSYRPPGYTRRVGESRAQQLGAVATATKEMSGYCENEHPNLDHMSQEENTRKFITQYTESFPDPNPSGCARGGHTSGGILPALPNGYTRSTRVAAYRHIATQK